MLEVDNVTVRFAGLTAVSELTFAVARGEICTVMGPNGAGKTSVFNAITGFVRPAAGEVRFDSKRLTGMRPEAVAATGIRRTFQNNGLLREMSVLENVLTGLELGTASSILGVVLGLGTSIQAERAAVERARSVLARLGIESLADRVAGDLSFGQQRLVEIARALVGGVKLLMLDEPAVGLSPRERMELVDVLREVVAREGIGLLLVEHVQDVVMAVSDRVVVLNYGRKIAECAPSEVHQNQTVLEAYLGTG